MWGHCLSVLSIVGLFALLFFMAVRLIVLGRPWLCTGSGRENTLARLNHAPTIWADFNAQDEDHSIALACRGSMESLGAVEEKFDVRPGDYVWLSDGGLKVRARLALRVSYSCSRYWVGEPDWGTMIDLTKEDGA